MENLDDVVKKMDIDKIRDQILLDCGTSSDVGLYQIIWLLHDSGSEFLWCRYYYAESIIRDLIEKEQLYLYQIKFNDNYTQELVEDYDSKIEMIKVLTNPTSWYPDYHYIRVCVEITEKGRKENPHLFKL